MVNNGERALCVVSEERVNDTGAKLEASLRNYTGSCLRELVKLSARAATKLRRVETQIDD